MANTDRKQTLIQDAIPVVAIAIFHPRKNKYLIVRRNAQQSGAGHWEFPGGKVENGESLTQALVREIKEELDFEINEKSLQHIHTHQHQYPNKNIELTLFRYVSFEENFKLIDHDLLAWVDQKSIGQFELSDADLPFVKYLF